MHIPIYMREKIVAGNWKMNKDLEGTRNLITELINGNNSSGVSVKIAPTFVNLMAAKELVAGSDIEVMAQNMHFADNGAFTGEIAAGMLKAIGVEEFILGHSERRSLFGETDELLKKKVRAALDNGMKVMFCFGELLEERKAANHFKVVHEQLAAVLFDLDEDEWQHIILAYEPVWAIGTGETASPEQAQEMHAYIRKSIAEAYTDSLADTVSILYGGSVKPGNAEELFGQPDVDGGLIGGASLVASDFLAIIEACSATR